MQSSERKAVYTDRRVWLTSQYISDEEPAIMSFRSKKNHSNTAQIVRSHRHEVPKASRTNKLLVANLRYPTNFVG